MTTIAVTGATGFIGTHAVLRLSREPEVDVIPVSRADFQSVRSLQERISGCDTVLHLAGKNRGDDREVEDTNEGLAHMLVEALQSARNKTAIVLASSTQRHLENAYGRSKRRAEGTLAAAANGGQTVLEIPNVFGPGCRPFYNSVVATFCYQLTHGERPEVVADKELELVWIGDLVETLRNAVLGADGSEGVVHPEPVHRLWVSELQEALSALYQTHFGDRLVPECRSDITRHLYRTLVSYSEPESLAYAPTMLEDQRGYLFECVRQLGGGGQSFFSRTKPGVERGNHYHTRKYEKFCVVEGEAVVRLRWVGGDTVLEYRVSGSEPQVIDIPVFHAHSIENIGEDDLLTIFWSNEVFDPEDPDTHREGVRQ